MSEIDWSTPSREADAWIAEHVMGWEVVIGLTHLGVIAYVRRMHPDRRGYIDDVPCFTQDSAAAWEIMKALADREVYVSVEMKPNQQCVVSWAWMPLESMGMSFDLGTECPCEQLPLAICHAAYLQAEG